MSAPRNPPSAATTTSPYGSPPPVPSQSRPTAPASASPGLVHAPSPSSPSCSHYRRTIGENNPQNRQRERGPTPSRRDNRDPKKLDFLSREAQTRPIVIGFSFALGVKRHNLKETSHSPATKK